MPVTKRLGPFEDAELWRRASEYLKKLTADVIDDRLQALSQQAANELIDER